MLIGYLSLAPEQLAGGLSAPHNALIACGVGRLYIDVKGLGEARPQLDAAFRRTTPPWTPGDGKQPGS